MIAQHAGNGIGADDGLPVVGFGEFVGNAALAPGRMLGPQRHDLGCKGGVRAGGLFGRRAGKLLKGRVPALVETGFPVIEGPAVDVGGTAGLHDIAGGLPRFKQESSLLGGGERKVNAFRHGSIVSELGA